MLTSFRSSQFPDCCHDLIGDLNSNRTGEFGHLEPAGVLPGLRGQPGEGLEGVEDGGVVQQIGPPGDVAGGMPGGAGANLNLVMVEVPLVNGVPQLVIDDVPVYVETIGNQGVLQVRCSTGVTPAPAAVASPSAKAAPR